MSDNNQVFSPRQNLPKFLVFKGLRSTAPNFSPLPREFGPNGELIMPAFAPANRANLDCVCTSRSSSRLVYLDYLSTSPQTPVKNVAGRSINGIGALGVLAWQRLAFVHRRGTAHV
jgi:hypothetical protein